MAVKEPWIISGLPPPLPERAALISFESARTSLETEEITYLLDYVQSPYFTDENVESEKGIIGEEINMCDDRVTDVLYEKKNLLVLLFSQDLPVLAKLNFVKLWLNLCLVMKTQL